MKKIMITGPVGSGKTTLARQLAKKKDVPFYELDNLIWQRLAIGDQKRSECESSQLLQEILLQNEWIIEGTTTKDWIEPALSESDVILLLLPPYYLRVYRIITRFIKQTLKKETAHYKPSLHLLVNLFRWNHHFEKKNLLELQKLTADFPEKLVILNDSNPYRSYSKILTRYK
ncbi:shikimate kinase [Candidatus Enterococcus mansonii]|uniref:DNA topology modulation protein FlaR n=1 Tax=Candidatus Enterococcus mansonii TaxID=1834181 RepID=A0A242CL73_9ENTE|nr:shikimate kinase [Enterococcus sp. 4G2_DIV0659]OTO10532.1 hypothetical protein A5880_001216 [Enterococcus sp. 4G2_DIV0659]